MKTSLREELQNRSQPLQGLALGPMSKNHNEDHTLAQIQKNIASGFEIVEIDLRKSKDGVLFGYHGTIPWGHIHAQLFLHHKSFSEIKEKIQTVVTLADLLKVIPANVIISLDIKQKTITGEDVQEVIATYSDREFIIRTLTLYKAKKMRKIVGEKQLYASGIPLLFPSLTFRRAVGVVDILPLFFWQCSRRLLQKLERAGMMYCIERWFTTLEYRSYLSSVCHPVWIYSREVESIDNRSNTIPDSESSTSFRFESGVIE